MSGENPPQVCVYKIEQVIIYEYKFSWFDEVIGFPKSLQ